MAKSIDVKSKSVVACFPKDAGLDERCFKVRRRSRDRPLTPREGPMLHILHRRSPTTCWWCRLAR